MQYFSKAFIRRLDLYLKNLPNEFQLYKISFNKTNLHIPNSLALSNYCYQLKQELFFKDFDGSLGTIEDLITKHSFEKAETDSDLIILNIMKDLITFRLFHMQAFFKSLQKQKDSNQPLFFVSDAIFSLLRNNYKLLIIGMDIFFLLD